MNIKGISNIGVKPLGTFSENISEETISFSDFLKESIGKLNVYENEVNEYDVKIASGELENIHEAMIATQKADIALQLTMQIRNKILEAYREIMRMQI